MLLIPSLDFTSPPGTFLCLKLGWRISPYFLFSTRHFIVLTLYTLTSVRIFSIMFSLHLLRCWRGEFVYQSRASLVSDNFLYSRDLNVQLRGDFVRRNKMLVTPRDQRLKLDVFLSQKFLACKWDWSNCKRIISHSLHFQHTLFSCWARFSFP